ncbi:MAG: APC family permease [Verrucomicrobiales bacterium]|nr:APC family permease [Verrucomicrobiales bacterium]
MNAPSAPVSRHQIRLPGAVAVVVGSMIGVAVYASLGFQLAAVPGAFHIVLLWTLGAAIAFLGAVSYAELAAALPKSGGEYHFLSRIYHPGVGFLSGWISLIAGFPGPVAFAAVAFAGYLLNGLAPGWSGDGVQWTTKAIAAGLIFLVTLFHVFSLRTASRFHGWFTALKVLLLAALVGACLWFVPQPQPVQWLPSVSDWQAVPTDPFVTSLYYVLYAYSGWNAACYITSEVAEPQRRVPLALLIGVGVVFVLYLALNAAFLHVAPMSAYVDPANLSTPAFVAAHAVFGGSGARVVSVLVCLGLISSVSAMTWTGPRVTQRMGQDYRMLSLLGRTNAHGVPTAGIWLQSVLAATYVFVFETPDQLVLYVTFLLQVSVFLTVLGVFVLRVREPNLPRPYRAWGYPVTPVLFLLWEAVAMTIFLTGSHEAAKKGLATLAAGIAIYLLCRMEQHGKKSGSR